MMGGLGHHPQLRRDLLRRRLVLLVLVHELPELLALALEQEADGELARVFGFLAGDERKGGEKGGEKEKGFACHGLCGSGVDCLRARLSASVFVLAASASALSSSSPVSNPESSLATLETFPPSIS